MEDGRINKDRVLEEYGTRNPRPERVSDPLFQEQAFFDACDLVQVKYEMLRRVRVENRSVSEAARLFGFSRVAFYQTQAAFQREGLPGLAPKRCGPKRAHKVTAAVLDWIDQRRAVDSNLRAPELAALIHKQRGLSIHPRSIERALARREKGAADFAVGETTVHVQTWTTRYEDLRRAARQDPGGHGGLWGLALFLRHGLVAWMRAWPAPALAATGTDAPPALNPPCVPLANSLRRPLVNILATMVLTRRQEVCV